MAAYLIVDIDVQDEETYQGYVEQAPAFVAKHGGRYRVRGGNAEIVEGDWQPARFVVVEFPSKAHAQAFIDDPEYQKVAEIRRASTKSQMILVKGFE